MTYKSQEFSSKVRILDFPVKSPGKCANCGANHHRDGRQYLDFGLSIQRYGAVYFCTVCINEMGEVIGMMTKVDAESLTHDWESISNENSALKEVNERLTRFCDLFADYANSDVLRTSLVEASSGNDQPPKTADNKSVNIVERRARREAGLAKSVDERGSEDLLHTKSTEF